MDDSAYYAFIGPPVVRKFRTDDRVKVRTFLRPDGSDVYDKSGVIMGYLELPGITLWVVGLDEPDVHADGEVLKAWVCSEGCLTRE